MTTLRSYVRRGLARDPTGEDLPEGLELGWLTYKIMDLSRWELRCGSFSSVYDRDFTPVRPSTTLRLPNAGNDKYHRLPFQKIVEIQAHIQDLVMWNDELHVISNQLATAITQVIRIVLTDSNAMLDSLQPEQAERATYIEELHHSTTSSSNLYISPKEREHSTYRPTIQNLVKSFHHPWRDLPSPRRIYQNSMTSESTASGEVGVIKDGSPKNERSSLRSIQDRSHDSF
ncbi:hypothetical protein M501DRAFT_684134 [Patellaria atrata CBS 101060]|uniref:Uncharacterized protein n=1 Tax=Patellaria atrata CBS 101060 TaxID=1346257 RepID=A0A9P4SEQ7_9PEZI|nr:hypothetical protein M501DRAFT_684134 [Patellaria atrata CBS 101060]